MSLEEKASLQFLKLAFYNYYSRNRHQIMPPVRSGRREYGMIYLGEGFMKRHMSFMSSVDLRSALAPNGHGYINNLQVPAHVYYSVAYYDNPGARSMEDKGWRGADLVFDLDADHLKGADDLSYTEQLDLVKRMVKRLLYEFLLKDFGFDERYVCIVFSGGRGYHVHVRDPRVLDLDAHARREIVGYITGSGLDLDLLAPERIVGYAGQGTRWEKPITTRSLPAADEPGWRGRITQGVMSIVERISAMDDLTAVKYLCQYPGIGKKTAQDIYDELQGHMDQVRGGTIDLFHNDRLFGLFFELVKNEAVVDVQGETDEPVTTDTKRLIRLPTSLHGKTGLRVGYIPLHDLDRFDPLVEAVGFPPDPVKIKGVRSGILPLMHEDIPIEPGMVLEVPCYQAVFAIARKMAVIPVEGAS